MTTKFDFAVIGAGVFGAWTAHYLLGSGASVALVDAYGAASSRASSGGETRIIRMGYGPDELYTRWSARSLPVWQEFFARIERPLFHKTGVLWVSDDADGHLAGMLKVLGEAGVICERLTAEEVRKRFPQLSFPDITCGVYEPLSGVLMARQSVQVVVQDAVEHGAEYFVASVNAPRAGGRLAAVQTAAGESISAGTFVFACGPWLPKLFPELLAGRIQPTRQEIFFLGVPAGDPRFGVPHMPAWLHHNHPDRVYSLPDLENRGFKVAFDTHGPAIDPDTAMRVIEQSSIDRLRNYLRRHVPALKDAPLVETRVCQYENTSNGDFLIDRHPEMENVWLVGGGSGHGFKHGPAVGEYVSSRILRNAPAEPRFSLESKQTARMRAVY
jgi:monomeric sarcosine oxidase